MNKKISPRHFTSDWDKDLDDRLSVKWPKGIEIIQDRFESRYFNPLSRLIENADKEIKYNCGFLVMSVDCLLIETINQFYMGLKKTTDLYFMKNEDKNHKYNWQAFRDFFKHSTFFSDFKSNDVLVEFFFDEIRCGLLHQAESKIHSLINVRENTMVKLIDSNNLKNGIIINRTIFHNSLIKEFKKYLEDLGNPSSKNICGEYLRDKCNEKMKGMIM